MPNCRYCDDSFDTEDDYLTHLEEVHGDELGPIDRRRIAAGRGDQGGLGIATGPLVIGAVIVVVAALIGYVVFFADGGSDGSSGEITPHSIGTVHAHGTMEVVIKGTPIDFGQAEYQYHQTGVDAFHYEGGDGTTWHLHAQGVTLQWALASLGIEVTTDTVTIDDTTYRDGENATVTIEVNGQAVDPSEYLLSDGDQVRVVVE